MSVLDGVSLSELAYLIGVTVVSVTVAVAGLVAIATSEARSRQAEAERIAAIRHRLQRERLDELQPAGLGDGGRP